MICTSSAGIYYQTIKIKNMKIGVIGSRTFKNEKRVSNELNKYLNQVSVIVSGGANGPDSYAERWAKINNIKTNIFLPDFKSYARGAYHKRNIKIVENSNLIIAFWDGVSRGTKQTIELAKTSNIPVKIIRLVD